MDVTRSILHNKLYSYFNSLSPTEQAWVVETVNTPFLVLCEWVGSKFGFAYPDIGCIDPVDNSILLIYPMYKSLLRDYRKILFCARHRTGEQRHQLIQLPSSSNTPTITTTTKKKLELCIGQWNFVYFLHSNGFMRVISENEMYFKGVFPSNKTSSYPPRKKHKKNSKSAIHDDKGKIKI